MFDLSFLAPLAEAVKTHAYGVVFWLLLTAIVNTVFHFATPADVDAWAEKNPFVAKVAAFFRRWGIEPVAGLKAIAAFFQGNPPPPGSISKGATVLAFALALGVNGCRAWFPNGPPSVDTILKDGNEACILANALLPVERIQQACRIEGDAADVVKVIEAIVSAKTAGAREATAACKP